jgi:hypothetical protein
MKGTMQKILSVVMSVAVLAGCALPVKHADGEKHKQVLHIRWQRLVDERGQTCDRCGTTETAAEEAAKRLRRSLKQPDIAVVLEKVAVSASDFAKDPLQSNRIWIAEKPVEEWLQAMIGKNPCSGPCGDSECRTITVDGRTYNAITTELIVKAGLLAGAQLVCGKPWNQ